MPLRYVVRLPDPRTHLVHVDVVVPPEMAEDGAVVLRMPTWSPGSYLLREYAKHVQDVEAVDAQGKPLDVARVDKSGWRVTGATGEVTFRYAVYGHELTVRTNHIDGSHAHLMPTATFMYVDGHLDVPCEVTVRPPDGWRVDTGLPRRRGEPDAAEQVFHADDVDHLLDCPIEVGEHHVLEFKARGARHRVAIWGSGNFDAARVERDVRRIVLETSAIFGGRVPYDDYLFIVHLTSGGADWGGLEHRNSTTILANRFTFRPDKDYHRFLELVAHEYFHVWNVKRIKPEAFTPYEWQEENYTRLLWAMEGLTAYYDRIIPVRAGIVDPARYREALADVWKTYVAKGGRFKESVEESSLTAWTRFYRQDEHYHNAGISYYLKGELVGLALDLSIRDRTSGKKSLDDVMRHVWREHGHEGRPGIPEGGFRKLVEDAVGGDWRDFFHRYVEGTEDPPLARLLSRVGWKLEARDPDAGRAQWEMEGRGGWLGVSTRTKEGRLEVAEVVAGGPGEEMGIAPGDELVALDGWRVTQDSLKKRLKDWSSGDEVTVHVFRRDDLMMLTGRLGDPPPERWVVREVEKPSARARRLRDGWFASASSKR